MAMKYKIKTILLVLIFSISFSNWVFAEGSENIALQKRIEELQSNGTLQIEGVDVVAKDLIIELYASRNYQPLWLNNGRVSDLITYLKTAPQHGLLIEDYFINKIEDIQANGNNHADLDILASEAFIRFGYHQRFGKVNAHSFDSNINFKRELLRDRTPVELITDIASSSKPIEELVDQIIPRGPLYRAVQQALENYLEIQSNGGWQTISEGPTLHEGDQDSRVVQIRKRLFITGDLSGNTNFDSTIFDSDVVKAVTTFQHRNFLEDDGVAGAKTIATMNVPIQHRIDQMRLTLERIRWVQQEITDDFLAVNIASFRTILFRGGDVIWQSRVMVGKPYRQTPVFRGDIQYLEFNPTWTIPPGILRNDTLPAIKKDPNYLTERNISVIDSNGNKVDPQSVDWNAYTRGVPYTLRQEPGPNNALGRVKFIFPNKHFVFLHDTPSRTLFSKAERAFSSGCIRVQYPFQLAELLLDDPQQWNESAIQSVVDSKEIRRVNLREPFPVLIVYLTAVAEPDKPPRFLQDIYKRDEKLLEALNGKVTIEIPDKNE